MTELVLPAAHFSTVEEWVEALEAQSEGLLAALWEGFLGHLQGLPLAKWQII